MSFLYVRPDESVMFGSVSGAVTDTYLADWLVNGSPGYPVRGESGLALTVTPVAPVEVSLVSVVNHNLPGTVAISGGVTATVPAATLTPDGIYLNSWVDITPGSPAGSLTMTASGTPAIVGELIAGKKRQLERQLLIDPEFEPGEPFEWQGEFNSMAPYNPGVIGRKLTGETIVTAAGMAEIHAWYQSTRRGSRPTLIVPVDTVNDAWLVTFRYTWQPHIEGKSNVHRGLYRVRFQFVEIPRASWPA